MEALGSDIRSLQLQHQKNYQQLQEAEVQRSSSQEAIFQEVNERSNRIEQAQRQGERTHIHRISQQENTVNESISRLSTDQHLLQESIANLQTSHQRLELKIDVATSAQIASTAEREIRKRLSLASDHLNLSRCLSSALPTRIMIPLSLFRSPSRCTCICHYRRAHRTPDGLQGFLGSLFIGYTGIPTITPTCNDSACDTRSSPTLMLMYMFPAWLLARAFILFAKLSLSHGLDFNLRLPRVIHTSSSIWTFAGTGNLTYMKDLLKSKAMSPYDVDSDTGFTALMVRLGSSTQPLQNNNNFECFRSL